MEPVKGNRLLTTGAIGAIVAAVCCFTPVLVILFSALGLSAITGYLDYALPPVMVISLGLIVYGGWTRSRSAAENKRART